MMNNIYEDIPELNVRPYQLERLRETGSCTAKSEKEFGDIRFVQLNAAWHLFGEAPKAKEIILYNTTSSMWKDGLKQAFAPEQKDWAKFCHANRVDYWAYRDDVLPKFIR